MTAWAGPCHLVGFPSAVRTTSGRKAPTGGPRADRGPQTCFVWHSFGLACFVIEFETSGLACPSPVTTGRLVYLSLLFVAVFELLLSF